MLSLNRAQLEEVCVCVCVCVTPLGFVLRASFFLKNEFLSHSWCMWMRAESGVCGGVSVGRVLVVFFLFVCLFLCVYFCWGACVCVCVRTRVCVCVCVCV